MSIAVPLGWKDKDSFATPYLPPGIAWGRENGIKEF